MLGKEPLRCLEVLRLLSQCLINTGGPVAFGIERLSDPGPYSQETGGLTL